MTTSSGVAGLTIEFYLFGCPGCGIVVSQAMKRPLPLCYDPECERLMESLISWHEIVERIDGEGWKHS